MRIRATALLLVSGLVFASGCAGTEPSGESTPDFRPTATIEDIMISIVDPSADAIWESVATVVDFEGIHEHFPETDEEWAEVRSHALRVAEAANLLLIPGRRVAAPDSRSEYPEIELEPEQIQELIDDDPETFRERVLGLHDVAVETLDAIEARDLDALLLAGEKLDLACEHCHLNYWYPDDEGARELFEENRRLLEEVSEGGV